jgi:polysaccharide export outer membrane protein
MKSSFSVTSLEKAIMLMMLCVTTGCASLRPTVSTKSDDTSPMAQDSTSINLITSDLLINENTKREQEKTSDISKLISAPAPYIIESGDILSITVWDHPEFASNNIITSSSVSGLDVRSPSAPAIFTVDHQGIIQFPYVGQLKVGGFTEDVVRSMLVSKLAYYINKPNITLAVQSYRSKRIYIDGQVKAPGVQPITDIPMTLVEAINRADGFLQTADQSQIALNRNGSVYSINLPQLVSHGVNPAQIMLQNGDVIRVRSRDESKVFVSGEVVGPRSLIMHNGKLSLSEALGESGGINPVTGDSAQVYVVRKTKAMPVVYRLDASTPGALALAEGFELEPKDIVYVASTPLANWQRVISQLLPGGLSSAVSTIVPPR